MFIEVESVFRTEKTVINLDLVTEINKEKLYVRMVDGKKYHIADIGNLLKMVEPKKIYSRPYWEQRREAATGIESE